MAEPGGTLTDREGTAATPAADTGPQTFTFHLPDGKSASVKAPRGTTNAQAWGYLTQQHPEYGRLGGGSTTSPTAGTQGTTATPQRNPNAPDPVGFIAGLTQGVADLPEAVGQMIQKGGEAVGVNPSRLVPGFVERGADALRNRAEASNAGQVGRAVGSLGTFLFQPELGIAKAAQAVPYVSRALGPAATVFERSTVPAILQPTETTKDPNFWQTKGVQALLGTTVGEALQGVSRLAGKLPERWQREARDYIQRILSGRTSQLSETAARQAARDTEEQARQKAYSEAKAQFDKASQDAAAIEARNTARQQVVDRLNQRADLDYAGRQAGAAADEVRRLDIPRQAVRDVLNDARGLIGLRPLEQNLSREAAPQALREVGQELDRIYGQMRFDPNQGGWLANAQRTQREINQRLRQDPRAQALWNEVFQDKAFMPALRAEAGAGAPAMGVAPGIVRSPTGQSFAQRSLPTGEIQGPLGSRSGPITGDQLTRMMSVLTKARQRFGLEAQSGGGGVYNDMATGLARMQETVQQQLERNFPHLAEQLRQANQAYYLTSRVIDAIDVHGGATPEALLKAFKSAEGDTRFGTSRTFSDIKDRLERQHQEFTDRPQAGDPPVRVRGFSEDVPKVGKEPTPPDPLPPPKPVPLRVPGGTAGGERLPHGTAALAGEAAGHLGRATGIPGASHAGRGLVRALVNRGKPALDPLLRGTRDVSSRAARPASATTGQLVGTVADMERRRRERREQRQRSQ